nr:unnamed protein product [Callosobruchus chinensis]
MKTEEAAENGQREEPSGPSNISLNYGRPSRNALPAAIRFDNIGHMIVEQENKTRRRCRQCKNEVLDDLNCSDHFPIQISTNIEKRFSSSHQRWLTRKANWENYVGALSIPPPPEDPIVALSALTNCIQKAASASIPQSSSFTSNKSLPWWNQEVKDFVQKKKSALNIIRPYPTALNMIILKKIRAKSREAQKKSWQEYVSPITSEVPIREVWKKIKVTSGNNYYTRPPKTF